VMGLENVRGDCVCIGGVFDGDVARGCICIGSRLFDLDIISFAIYSLPSLC